MVRENWIDKMVRNIMENLVKVYFMVKVLKFFRMVIFMKGILLIQKDMVKVNLLTKTEIVMKENLTIIK
jgi:hypothetical protein